MLTQQPTRKVRKQTALRDNINLLLAGIATAVLIGTMIAVGLR